jgi:hypothetical protein
VLFSVVSMARRQASLTARFVFWRKDVPLFCGLSDK